MAYNKAREERKWRKWKEEEEQKLRKQGMDEAAIRKLYESDWEDFKSDRRYQEHQTPKLEMETLFSSMSGNDSEIQTVDDLLNAIENEALLHILMETDKKTLQILLMRMMGYTVAEITQELEMTDRAVYCRIDRLKEKIKKIF